MSKISQKEFFEKFYREHTGNIHNVKPWFRFSICKRIVEIIMVKFM
jgi:hypothetical protein